MDMLGMYPTFYVPGIGTAWVMGIIGVIHVVASHTSVGASFLFALLETKAYRENKPYLLDFIRKYGMFLLVFSYIIGSITGPGIWYAITVASPRGVGGLIHNFVWVWAAEWVYFTVEVIGVYALVYLLGKIDAKTHLKLTWSFALASWATMLLIVGILSFMMWPGHENWYLSGSTNDAFYNLNFFAHLGTRTGSMLVIATLVGLMVASRLTDAEERRSVVRFLAPIGLVGGLFSVMMFLYYLQTLPHNAIVMLNTHLLPIYAKGMVAVFSVATLWLLFAWWKPHRLYTALAIAVFAFVSVLGVWPEERMRESMRKPYVAGQYIYGNQVIARDVPGKGIVGEVDLIAEKGLLHLHPFIPDRLRQVSDSNRLEVGKLLTQIACANCHALEPGAPLRNLPDKFHRATDEDLIAAFLNGPLKHGSQSYMPRIDLPATEVNAIAHYLASVNRGVDVEQIIVQNRALQGAQRLRKEIEAMDIGTVLNTMRDPAGVPAHPVLFQGLMVFTWIFHIAFVHITLGAAGLAIFAFHRRDRHPHWEMLSIAMTKAAKVGVSLLIVLGVAPLLFTQVIYDPQWYASNVLSGVWVIGFIFSLIVAYCAWFVFYYANHAGAKRHIGVFAWIGLLLFCLDGLIMHALSYQALLPDQWMHWYAPQGVVDNSGLMLHAIQWPRYVFIMGLSVPVIGVFLIAYTHYVATREDRSADYRRFVHRLGQGLATWGFASSLLPLLLWQMQLPAETRLLSHPLGWLLVAALLLMTIWMWRRRIDSHAYLPLSATAALLALLALWREVIRIAYLRPFGYDIATYPMHVDWPSTLLFFSTLLGVGGLVGGFYLTLLYRAGRTDGVYIANSAVARLGTGAVTVLVLWIAVFFAYGISIWVGNSFV